MKWVGDEGNQRTHLDHSWVGMNAMMIERWDHYVTELAWAISDLVLVPLIVVVGGMIWKFGIEGTSWLERRLLLMWWSVTKQKPRGRSHATDDRSHPRPYPPEASGCR